MPHRKGGNMGGLASAMQDISYQLTELIAEIPFEDIFYGIFLPWFGTLCALVSVAFVIKIVKRIFIPPTATELHLEALTVLNSMPYKRMMKKRKREREKLLAAMDSNNNNNNKKKKEKRTLRLTKDEEEQAEELLQKSIDLNYPPAILSLAAMYIYRLQRPTDAIRLLEQHQTDNNEKEHKIAVKCLLLDAQALQSGHGDMIQSEIRQDEYLSINYARDCSVLHKAAAAAKTKKQL